MVGWVKKWEDKKLERNRKVRELKKFNFLSYVFGWEDGKVERRKTQLFVWKEKREDGKYNSNKFTQMSLLDKTIKTL